MPQNFQNWMGLDAAPQNPSSPSGIPGTEFQDWSNLTGPSDIFKQAMGVQRPGASSPNAPVVPPQNWGEAFSQAIAPFQQKFENISNAASQLGQGNTFNAYSALKGQKPVAATEQKNPSTEEGGFNFSRN